MVEPSGSEGSELPSPSSAGPTTPLSSLTVESSSL